MFKGEVLAKRDLAEIDRDGPHQYYLTKRGVNLFIPHGEDVGDVVYSPRSLHDDKMAFERDEIVALGNATTSED